MPEVKTTCCYCGVGCGIVVRRDAQGRLSLCGDPDHPANCGQLCSKGRTLLHTVAAQGQRLLHPELRHERGQTRHLVGWDEAIATVARRLRSTIAEHGPDSVGFYISGQCLTEEYYLANKLAKGCIGTNNIDTNSRLCMSSAVAGYKATLGADCVPGSYEDLDLADTFLICGSNMAWTHPILFRRVEARKQAGGERVRLICVDPRRTATAEVSDLHLALKPGTDVALYHGLAHCLERDGALDDDYIRDHVAGWEELRTHIAAWTPERTAAVCGVPEADLCQAARWLGGGRNFVSLWTMGLNQSAMGTDKNTALINLSLITGRIGRPGCGPFSLTGQPNAMGGREVGGLSNLLPAHRRLDDPLARAAVEDFWGVPRGRIAAQPGLTAVELFAAARSGRIKALWIIATNPVASLPAALGVDAALRTCPCVVVQDCSHNDTVPFADVVLPAATWLEKTGAMTNSERRIRLVEQLVEPPGEARADWRILRDVTQAMGFPAPYADAAAVFAEHAASTVGTDCDIGGLSHAALRQGASRQWPVPTPHHPGTPRLFCDGRFATPDGRARLQVPVFADRSEPLDAEHPLVLTTGRLRDQWHTMTRTGLVQKLVQQEPMPFCELHPDDAAQRGISDGDLVRVNGRRGEVRVPVRVTDTVRPGVCFLPMHWGPRQGGGQGRINAITSERLDPQSREPDLKYAAVQVARHQEPARRVVVIGAGAAARAFVEQHVHRSPADQVTVIGEEPHGFYNRVALPHLIAGQAGWDDIRFACPERIELSSGISVTNIDRQAHELALSDGSHLAYDICVLATGSRPTPGVDGIAGLRRRDDAERILAQAAPGSAAVIIGAGVLGIELADALQHRGVKVTLVVRGDRCMGRQLDRQAAMLLAAFLEDRGITLRFGAQVAARTADGVRLADGSSISATLVVAALGTQANGTLAQAAGLATQGGVVVDDGLQSADPAIYAIGECAVVAGRRVGTTAGASAQAEVLADRLRGHPHRRWIHRPEACILKVQGLALAAIGEVEAAPGDEVVQASDLGRGRYQSVLLRQDRVIGAVLVGDTAPFAELAELVRSGTELDERRDQLLKPGGATSVVAGKLVCSCMQVGTDTIRAAITAGCRDVASICARTKAGSGCGSCRPEIAGLLRAAAVPAGVAP